MRRLTIRTTPSASPDHSRQRRRISFSQRARWCEDEGERIVSNTSMLAGEYLTVQAHAPHVS
jgi:hypothetical protein